MEKLVEITYVEIEGKKEYETLITTVLNTCFQVENLKETKLYISVTLTNPSYIRTLNKQYRNIDKETDVLSFPMFEKEELESIRLNEENAIPDVLGDIVISIPRVEEQAKEYEHSFERELAYMVVHGFYHLMGYDHIEEQDKEKMRPKEEYVLNQLNIKRGDANE